MSIAQKQSFCNFAPKSKAMKRLFFRSEKDFLEELDGKVYAVSDKNGRYLCDVIEDDYLKLLDAGVLVDLDSDLGYTNIDTDCNVMLSLDLGDKGCNDFKEKFGLLIDIREKRPKMSSRESAIEYVVDNLILNSSGDELETSFVFMDGIAIQIESLESCIPVPNPIILTYPRIKEVYNNVRMRDEIDSYRSHSWDGDCYSIALLYGEEKRLKS